MSAGAEDDVARLMVYIERDLAALPPTDRDECVNALQALARRARVRAAKGPAWSMCPAADEASWPAAWARQRPHWITRAAAVGVAHKREPYRDRFIGERGALVALGIVGEGDFPGDVGRGPNFVSFACDGQQKGQGGPRTRYAINVTKRARERFCVDLFPPAEVDLDQADKPATNWLPDARADRAAEHYQRTGVLPAWAPRALPAGWRVIQGGAQA